MSHSLDPRAFARAVFAYAARWKLFDPAGRALVMVSGGQDSVTLLHLLATGALGPAGPREVHVLHVNHGLRGEASALDQALVERLCAELGVVVTVLPGPIEAAEGNRQERARVVRRSLAATVAAEIGADAVALGHTLDDQVETILYRLGRYAGLDAVAGMRPRDGSLARPLLSRRRWETQAYCEALGLAFARDLGNDDPAYVRTALRRRVVPAWEGAVPGSTEVLGRLAETAAETVDLVEASVEAVAEFVARRPSAPGGRSTEVAPELSAARLGMVPGHLRRAFLHRWLLSIDRGAPTRMLVLAVDRLIGGGGSGEVAVGEGLAVRREYDRVMAVPTHPPDASPPDEMVLLPVPGTATWGDLRVTAEVGVPVKAHDPRCAAYLDARVIQGPVHVRAGRAGDRVRPLGAPGRRSLQDVLVDMRVPRHARPRIPVVVCGGRVLWVVGLTPAEAGRIRPDTERVVRLSVVSTCDRGCPAHDGAPIGPSHGENHEDPHS